MTDFTLAPPIDGDWKTLDTATAALVGERLRNFAAVPLAESVGAMRILRMPCFKEYLLCDVTVGDAGPEQAMMSFLYGRDGVWRLTGDSQVIHMANETHAPDLSTPELQALYLRFFCFFVHGAEGPFEVVTDPACLVPGDFDTSPVGAPEKNDETGYWSTTVLYGRALFQAEFEVEAGGQVRMESDDVIAEDVTRRPEVIFDGALRRLRQEES